MPACRYCGFAPLAWRYTAVQGWRLHQDSVVHECAEGHRAAQTRRTNLPLHASERYPEAFKTAFPAYEAARNEARSNGPSRHKSYRP